MNKIYDYPQSKLEDIIDNYDRGGFCAPAAASNILSTFYGAKKIDQGQMIKTLASDGYMNTDPNVGTSMGNFMRGISRYANENFRKKPYVAYQGIGAYSHFHTSVFVPEIDWIMDGIGKNKGTWLGLHLAKYDEDEDAYRVIGGHLVTLVGYHVNAKSTVFIINDSASPKDASARNEYLKLESIQSGFLIGGAHRASAEGFLKVIDGQQIQYATDQDYDTIIITGVVRVELE